MKLFSEGICHWGRIELYRETEHATLKGGMHTDNLPNLESVFLLFV